jgi:hypothetical protein
MTYVKVINVYKSKNHVVMSPELFIKRQKIIHILRHNKK